jgi:dephospho-CoA kinase
MYKVLICGGIGSGKSTACRLFGELGIPIFYSDLQAAKLMNFNPDVVEKIKSAFGGELYLTGKLDRKALGEIVFNSEDKLRLLESIVHPAVSDHFDLWFEVQERFRDSEYVIEESAIGIELGIQDRFDLVIVVTADEDTRIKRTMERDNCTEEQVRDRMKNQMPDEEKLKYADYVIVNNDFPNLECQVKSIHKKILDRIKK